MSKTYVISNTESAKRKKGMYFSVNICRQHARESRMSFYILIHRLQLAFSLSAVLDLKMLNHLHSQDLTNHQLI